MFWRRWGRNNEDPETLETTEAREAEPSEGVEPHERTTFDAKEPGQEPGQGPVAAEPIAVGSIEIERDASRPAQISRVAEDLEARHGLRVVELFEEVESTHGRATLPIHARHPNGEDAFFEVETGPWNDRAAGDVLRTAAVLRSSGYAPAAFEVLGAYPVPREVRFFSTTAPAALFQLDLVPRAGSEDPESRAADFVEAAARHWDVNLDFYPEGLTLVEDLLLAALREGGQSSADGGENAPVLDDLVRSLGCYVGETLRRSTALPGSWKRIEDWGEDQVVEFEGATADPIGKARAFLTDDPEDDSVAYYVSYVLEELERS